MNAQHAAEAARVELAFQIALAKIGGATAEQALRAWASVTASPSRLEATSDRWVGDALQVILGRRSLTLALTRAFYRLIRALYTGKTISEPGAQEKKVELAVLREDFARAIRHVDRQYNTEVHGHPNPAFPPGAEEGQASEQYDPGRETEPSTDIEVEDLDVEAVLDEVSQENFEKAEESLASQSTDRLRQEADELDREDKREQAAGREPADRSRREEVIEDRVGSQAAATASRHAMNEGRHAAQAIAQKDKRAIGWIRVSLSGSPCAFCAMLISRGLAYRSEQSAGGKEPYHDNCNCVAFPVFSRDQLDLPQYAQNKELSRLWRDNIRGTDYRTALNAWRTLLRDRARSASTSPGGTP